MWRMEGDVGLVQPLGGDVPTDGVEQEFDDN
ncbi:hypothetical protein BH18ACT6_BH18ACT6_13860 [soil metagenome]